MMLKRLLFFGFLCLNVSAFGQKQGQELIDSLISEIPKQTNDTLKARLYNRASNEYFFINTDKALAISRQGLKLVTKMKWNKGLGVFNSQIARAFSDLGSYDSCIYYNKLSVAFHKKTTI